MTKRGKKSTKTIEFGDFQTPMALARAVCRVLASRGSCPASVVEPTCGLGNFLIAALERFPAVQSALGIDINASYVESTKAAIARHHFQDKTRVLHGDFFELDWPAILRELPEPVLLIGNPPWVTNSQLATLGSENLPKKSNFQGRNGLDAITGKANFDISEWMLIRLLEWLGERRGTLAMLCKTAVARKALAHAWRDGIALSSAEMYAIDAKESFGASVDACLFACEFSRRGGAQNARVLSRLEEGEEVTVLGYHDGRVIADARRYDRWKHLRGSRALRWRSGVKHDCGRVMELVREGRTYRNGLGELVELEDAYVYPMLKSSELANDSVQAPKRWMLVTQQRVAQETRGIQTTAPKTWHYLESHGDVLDRRASSIYRKQPRFSIFGVGPYTFAPWKVAVSGFYKRLHFAVIGSIAGKPIVLDDTCYFIPCPSRADAEFVASLLNSQTSREFFSSLVFWEAKRPITGEILGQLDLVALASELRAEPQRAEQLLQWTRKVQRADGAGFRQQELFPAPS